MGKVYPGVDISAGLPLLFRDRAEVDCGSGSDSSSFCLLERREGPGPAGSGDASALVPRLEVFLFRGCLEAVGVEDSAVAGLSVDRSAASLAEERVILEDMRTYFKCCRQIS